MSLNELINKFEFEKVLASNPQTKTLVMLGTIDDKPGIITVEKSHFTIDENLDDVLPIKKCDSEFACINSMSEIKTITQNDIYYWGLCILKQDIDKSPTAKLNLIYPATETHIKKYTTQQLQLINETPEMYEKYVVPYINKMVGDRLKWVRNILYEGAEADRIVYNDLDEKTGFVLLPDMKWDGINIDSLYLVSIVYRDDIKSLRDLNITHIDWLNEINVKIRNSVSSCFKIKPDHLRLFIHYQPSYYHFHIHVVNILHPGLGDGIAAGKAIILEDLIDQLSYLGEDGFKKRTISYVIGENHELWRSGLKDEHYKNLKKQGINID